MIDRIIELSARHRFIVFLFTTAAVMAGWWALRSIPLDAIPDLSDTQVIIYSRWDRSPDIMEDQVTYPIVSAMLGAPKVKDVRGFSDFGYSTCTSSSRTAPTSTGRARARSSTSRRSCRGCRRASTPRWGRTPPAWAGSSIRAGG